MDRPMRPCKHPGCSTLTKTGWCAEHQPKHKRGVSSEWHWMYNDRRWKALRQQQLIREPFCAECIRRGAITPARATEVDHITPHRGSWRMFLDKDNLQSLCHRCHSAKTMAEIRRDFLEQS